MKVKLVYGGKTPSKNLQKLSSNKELVQVVGLDLP